MCIYLCCHFLDCECSQCTSDGFYNEEQLEDIVNQEDEVIYSMARTSVIPDLQFTLSGTVTAWQFAARPVLGIDRSEQLPQYSYGDHLLRVSSKREGEMMCSTC